MLAVAAAKAAVLGNTVAHAQKLEEVLVTAQKRAESLQDVPISVAAVSGENVRNFNIQRFEQLSAYVPNFSVSRQAIGDTINIRGIQSGNQAGFEQSVGTFVDGVYRGRGTQIRNAFMDVATVEVLRGPQGTLFGKNTVAGALNIRTNGPTDDFESTLTAMYTDEFDETEFQGYGHGRCH
jgi:outer membrane receptor protein involved in Fe transport